MITGSGGLIGSESAQHFVQAGYDVIGLENDMRARVLRPAALHRAHHRAADRARWATRFARWRSTSATAMRVDRVFAQARAGSIELVIHTAAQPSHDWAASDPQTDFTVNANGTLNLLEATRDHAPSATFIFCSTNKVYGDLPNHLPLRRARRAPGAARGPPLLPRASTRRCRSTPRTHSLFGVSKAAADLLVQEYGRYFEMPTVCFRGGCLTGPQPRGREAARLPVLSDAVHDDRRALHGVRLRRQAGARQHPLRRSRVARSTPFTGRRGPPPSTTSAAAAPATARCSRRSSCARRSPAGSSTGRCRTRTGSAITAGGSPTWTRSGATIPDWDITYDVEGVLREIHDHNVELWEAARVKLSVVIPAHNEVESIGETVEATVAELRAGARSSTRSWSSTTPAATAPATPSARSPHAIRTVRCVRSHQPPGFGHAVRAGLDAVHRRRGGDHDGRSVGLAAGPGPLLPSAGAGLRLRVRDALRQRRADVTATRASSSCSTGSSTRGIRVPVPARLQRHDERVQGIPAARHRPDPAAALKSLQPDRRDAAQGGRAAAITSRSCRSAGPTGSPRRLEAASSGDGQPVHVHRPLRVARASPEPRRLSPQ